MHYLLQWMDFLFASVLSWWGNGLKVNGWRPVVVVHILYWSLRMGTYFVVVA